MPAPPTPDIGQLSAKVNELEERITTLEARADRLLAMLAFAANNPTVDARLRSLLMALSKALTP